MMNRTLPLALAVFLLLSPILHAEYNLSYMLTLGYNGTGLWMQDLQLADGDSTSRPPSPDEMFALSVLNDETNVLYTSYFSISLQPAASPPPGTFDSEGNQIVIPNASEKNVSSTSYVVTAPYFAAAKFIEIKNEQNQTMLMVDVSGLVPPAPVSSGPSGAVSPPPAASPPPSPIPIPSSSSSSLLDNLAFMAAGGGAICLVGGVLILAVVAVVLFLLVKFVLGRMHKGKSEKPKK